jgi:NTP pyrophosphatase (non-canonical NTP hydrolase)
MERTSTFHDPTVHVDYGALLRAVAAEAREAGEEAEAAVAERLSEIREEFDQVGAVVSLSLNAPGGIV